MRFLSISVVIVVACVATSAFAITKCVNLSASMTCEGNSTTDYSPDWSATCVSNGEDVTVTGVAMCSNADSSTGFSANPAFGIDGNIYCYCKMTMPVVSKWVFYGSLEDMDACNARCNMYCANMMADPDRIKMNMMLNNLISVQ